jgi:hypothetical protein
MRIGLPESTPVPGIRTAGRTATVASAEDRRDRPRLTPVSEDHL